MNTSIPTQNNEFVRWLDNFCKAAEEHAALLELSPAQVQMLMQSAESSRAAVKQLQAQRMAFRVAAMQKKEVVEQSTGVVREVCRKVQALPTVPDTVKQELGIAIRHNPTRVVPDVPSQLSVKSVSRTETLLQWKRGDNIKNTLFLIEQKIGRDGKWAFLDCTTAAKYVLAETVLAAETQFRVRAKRGNRVSGYSNPVML